MEQLLTLSREALYLSLLIAAPPVLAATLTSVVVNVLQAATQISDTNLPFAPRLLAAVAALVVTAPWITAQLVRFTVVVFESIAHVS